MKLTIRTRQQEYGDKRTFVEYQIIFWENGSVVGIESGPRRATKTRMLAVTAARERIAVLKTHKLFAIPVTRQHIQDGDARNCNTCAIAQALWHKQDEMGFQRSDWRFELSPYGAFSDPRGLELMKRFCYGRNKILSIPAEELPEIVYTYFNDGKSKIYPEPMWEWAMHWDDWAEARSETTREYCQRTGERDGKPPRPSPTTFVLDLDEFKERDEATEHIR